MEVNGTTLNGNPSNETFAGPVFPAYIRPAATVSTLFLADDAKLDKLLEINWSGSRDKAILHCCASAMNLTFSDHLSARLTGPVLSP